MLLAAVAGLLALGAGCAIQKAELVEEKARPASTLGPRLAELDSLIDRLEKLEAGSVRLRRAGRYGAFTANRRDAEACAESLAVRLRLLEASELYPRYLARFDSLLSRSLGILLQREEFSVALDLARQPATAGIPDSSALLLQLGWALLALGDSSRALAPLTSFAASSRGRLGSLPAILAARAAVGSGDSTLAASMLTGSLETQHEDPFRTQALFMAANILRGLGRWEECWPLVSELISSRLGPREKARLLLLKADCLAGRGMKDEASDLYRSVLKARSGAPAQDRVRAYRKLKSYGKSLSTEELVRSARAMKAVGKSGEAVKMLKEALSKLKAGSRRRLPLEEALAAIYYENREYRKATRAYRDLIRSAGSHDRAAPKYRLRLARAYREAGEWKNALSWYRRVLRPGVSCSIKEQAFWEIGRGWEARGKPEKAPKAYRELGRFCPESKFAEDAAWRLGFCLYETGKTREALEWFTSLAERSSEVTAAARAYYWAGKLAGEAGLGPEAERLMRKAAAVSPDSYYGLRAASMLDLPQEKLDGSDCRSHEASSSTLSMPVSREARIFTELTRLGLAKDAAVKRLGRSLLDPNSASAVSFFDSLGYFDYSTRWRPGVRLTDCFPGGGEARLAYPLAEWPFVEKGSALAGLDPLLVLAVMRRESRFGRDALSRAGAQGLMQLMPATRSHVGRRIRSEWARTGRVGSRVEESVLIGCLHLGDLLSQFGGELAPAVAAYNAGAGPVRRWLRLAGSGDEDVFIENIAFSETRRYVKLVLEDYYLYRALYPTVDPEKHVTEPGDVASD